MTVTCLSTNLLVLSTGNRAVLPRFGATLPAIFQTRLTVLHIIVSEAVGDGKHLMNSAEIWPLILCRLQAGKIEEWPDVVMVG